MTRRPGLSLVEVLVALFIVGLGSIAIMTLFPLGALQMGQALKDDRTAQAAGQADGYMRWYWKHYVVDDISTNYPFREDNAGYGLKNPPGVLEPLVRAMEDPNDSDPLRFTPYYTPPLPSPNPTAPWWYSAATVNLYTPPSAVQKPPPGTELFPLRALYPGQTATGWKESGPSYPVFVDPIGFVAPWPTLAQQFWVGATLPNGSPDFRARIARRTISAIPPISTNFKINPTQSPVFKTPDPGTPLWTGMTNTSGAFLAPQAQKTCSMLDGLGYDPNGVANTAGGTLPVEREMRYNWAWVLQKVHQNDPNTATMTVVVFDKRAFQYVPQGGGEFLFNPVTYDASGNSFSPPGSQIGSTLVRFPAAAAPPVVKGGWIADVTHTRWTYLEPLPSPPAPQPGTTVPRTISAVRNFNWYRVVSVTDNSATTGTIDIELQIPLKADSMTLFDPNGLAIDNSDQALGLPNVVPVPPNRPAPFPPNTPQNRTFLYLAGVSEVFERVNLTQNQGP